jgi:hypothetical protein
MKIAKHHFKDGAKEGDQYWFWCPGCDCAHAFTVPPWTFDGNMESPTFSPSLLCNPNSEHGRCHLFVVDGQIKFCPDSRHALAGKTVELPEVPEWLIK